MRKIIPVMLGVFVLGEVAFGQQYAPEPAADFVIMATYYKPDRDDDYDYGFGGEAQIRFWMHPNAGFAFCGGGASWKVNEDELVGSEGFVAAAAVLDGNVNLYPVGGSMLLRPLYSENMSLTFEAGVRYVFVDSRMELEFAGIDRAGTLYYAKDKIEIDDGVVGLFAADLVTRFGPRISLLMGVGYQIDLSKGQATWLGLDAGENELKSLMGRAGFVMEF